jgi:Fe-S cluster assembly protein SufD
MAQQLAERHESYLSGFDAFRRDPAFGASGIGRAREAALERFLGQGFPTTRDEEWRFTNVAPIAAVPFERATIEAITPDVVAPVLFGSAGVTAVVVNGRLAPGVSTLASLPKGLTIRALGANSPELDLDVTPHVGRTAFTDLNTAFFETTMVVEVADGAVIEAPIHLVFVSVPGEEPALVSPRVSIALGRAAQATVIETYIDGGLGDILTNVVSEIRVGDGAYLDHVKVQREASTSFHMAALRARVGRAGTFTSHALTIGGRIARNDIVAVLDGEGAECTLNGLYVAGGDALVDTHTTIDHARPHCPSHELYKGILAGHARAVFNGKIIVRPDAQKTNAKQTNKALLLTDEAQINSKPQLEIFADDVKCTHGATVGQLDEDAMFYLQARGVPAAEARNLLIHAFAGDVLDGIKVEAVRDAAMALVEETLATV